MGTPRGRWARLHALRFPAGLPSTAVTSEEASNGTSPRSPDAARGQVHLLRAPPGPGSLLCQRLCEPPPLFPGGGGSGWGGCLELVFSQLPKQPPPSAPSQPGLARSGQRAAGSDKDSGAASAT